MKKNLVIAGALAAVLCVPLAACGSSSDSTSTTTDSGSATEATTTTTDDASSDSDSDFDANAYYVGEWAGSVEITGQTVYGTAGGNEMMETVTFAEDGTVDVTPDPDHTDLLTGTGTWTGTEDAVTITMDDGTEIVLTVVDSADMTGNAADFGIADFDTINFTFYG